MSWYLRMGHAFVNEDGTNTEDVPRESVCGDGTEIVDVGHGNGVNGDGTEFVCIHPEDGTEIVGVHLESVSENGT